MIALFGLAILAVPAQAALVLDDPVGDQELRVNGQTVLSTISGEPQGDLVLFSIEEGVDRLIFTRVAAGASEHLVARQWFTIDFDAGGHHYTIAGTPSANRLEVDRDGTAHFSDAQVGRSMTAHAEAHTLRFELPKAIFAGADVLREIETRTWVADTTVGTGSTDASGTTEIVDVVPNAGSADMDLRLRPMLQGPMAEISPKVYDSNGESGVYVFKVKGERLQDATISVEGPDGFRWATPDLAALEDPSAFVVLIAAPGAHQHGTEAVFWLVLEENGATSRIPFAIHYTAIPILTGHHDTLFLRAMQPRQTDGWVGGFMTTQPSPVVAATNPDVGGSHQWTSEPLSRIRTQIPANASAHVELHMDPPPGLEAIEVFVTPPGGSYLDAARGLITITPGASSYTGVLPFPAASFPGGEAGRWTVDLRPYSLGQANQAGTVGALHDVRTDTTIRVEVLDVPPMLQDDPTRRTTNLSAPANDYAVFDWPSPPLYGLAYCAEVDVEKGRLKIGNVTGSCEGGLVSADGMERLWIDAGPATAGGNAAVATVEGDAGRESPTPLIVAVVAIVAAALRRR